MFYNILVLGLNSFSGDSIIFSVLLGTWLKRNTMYCAYIKEGVGRIPTLKSQNDYLVIIAKFEPSIRDQWALKQVKKTLRFSKEQRAKLKAKLDIGNSTGTKLNPCAFAKDATCSGRRW